MLIIMECLIFEGSDELDYLLKKDQEKDLVKTDYYHFKTSKIK